MKAGMLAAVSAAAAGAAAGETVDVAYLKANHPDLAAALIAEGKAEAKAEAKADVEAARKAGADAERERILGIEKAALPGHEAIVAAHKADATKTPADTAMAIIEAEKATRSSQLAALDKDEQQVKVRSEPANPASASSDKHAGKTGAELWKAEYAVSKELQAEFGSEAAYVAFKRADASGQARILKK